jgi:hypothetical protein
MYRLLAINLNVFFLFPWLLVAGYWLLATVFLLLVTGCSKFLNIFAL